MLRFHLWIVHVRHVHVSLSLCTCGYRPWACIGCVWSIWGGLRMQLFCMKWAFRGLNTENEKIASARPNHAMRCGVAVGRARAPSRAALPSPVSGCQGWAGVGFVHICWCLSRQIFHSNAKSAVVTKLRPRKPQGQAKLMHRTPPSRGGSATRACCLTAWWERWNEMLDLCIVGSNFRRSV